MGWAPDYATTEELAAYLRIGDSDDDVALASALAAASRAIDQAADRQFGLVDAPEVRYFTARRDRDLGRWVVDIDDLMTTTGLVVGVGSVDTGVYTDLVTAHSLRPVNAAAKGRPWTQLVVSTGSLVVPTTGESGVQIAARWGWTAVPPAVKSATLLQASRLFARRDSPYGVAGSPTDGSEVRLLARVDPDVAVALRPYRRTWGVV